MLAEAQNAFRHSETPLSDDEVTDLSAVRPDTSLRETEQSVDAFPQTVGTSSPATDLDRSGLSDSPGPRSALKGTATAASTKRRQDALQQLIRSAEERGQSESGEVRLPPLIPGVDKLTWILANDLYDCHAQLLKTQSQLQLLEQRLATQEAAAEEAIERLCLQCRHVELRLNETHSRLNEYVQAHQEGRLLFTDITESPQTASNGHSPNVTSPCKTVSKADNDVSSLPPNDLTSNAAAGPVHSKPELGGVEDAGGEDAQNHIPRATPADATTSVTTDEVTTWSQKQVQDRARLISSGGLSNRRPRTRVVINPPPTLLTETSVSTASSSTDVTYVQSVTQHLLFPVPTGGQSSASPIVSPASSSKVDIDVRGAGDIASMMDDSSKSPDTAPSSAIRTPRLNDSSHCSPAASSTMGTPDSASSRISSHKAMGIQLPGLSPGMLQGVHLRRRSPTPDQPLKDNPGSKP
ncbi:hypothetical protein CRM22_009357 [Opisthorchis felineus]|nr:hypothetical protein CRM22_009357 [Opisthorchis felineus]